MTFHNFLQIFCTNFKEGWQKTCLDVRSLLFLCNKELQKKFAPILIVFLRWRHIEKTKTVITWSRRDFDLLFFLKSDVFWRCFSWKKYMLSLECSTVLSLYGLFVTPCVKSSRDQDNGVNPFHATDLFWYPQKIWEYLWFSDIFRGYQRDQWHEMGY